MADNSELIKALLAGVKPPDNAMQPEGQNAMPPAPLGFANSLGQYLRSWGSASLAQQSPNWVGRNILSNPDLQGPLLASSFLVPGARGLRLPPELIHALRSEGFDTGRTLYHGTVSQKPFDRYDLAKAGSSNDGGFVGEGVYLTPDFSTAKGMTFNNNLWRQRTNYRGDRPPLPDEYGHVTENYIRGNVFDVDRQNWQDTLRRIQDIYPEYRGGSSLATTAEQARPFSEAMQRAGYSAVNDPGHAVVVLNPDDVRIVGRRARDGTPLP